MLRAPAPSGTLPSLSVAPPPLSIAPPPPCSCVWRRICLVCDGGATPAAATRVVAAAAQQTGTFGDSSDWSIDEESKQQQEQRRREQLERERQRSSSSSENAKVFGGKWKWWGRRGESALSRDAALPLPMAYPGSKPLPREELDRIASCDPQEEDCKDVINQWTGECRRCQGTGTVSFYRKNGREVISKCILCLGIGYVHNHTTRDVEIQDLD